MEFAFDDDQEALVGSVAKLLGRYAGPTRARELGGDDPAYDFALESALIDAGFLDLARNEDAGPLEAALVVEAVTRAAGVMAVGARALVAPAILDEVPPGPVALTREGYGGPVRFATDARTLLVAGADGVRVVEIDPALVEPVPSRFGYPMGRFVEVPPGRVLDGGSSVRMLAWWRVALAVELAGAMRAALDLTVEHVKQREQFGRPLGSFQAIQHRLAEALVAVEASRWLALEAAGLDASPEAAAAAAVQAVLAARVVFPTVHQFTGAIGFTTEYDLHVWTLRLPALWVEAGWMGDPGIAVTSARWGPAAA